ncbi:MAG: polysaccharide export periplasmic protein [Alphaproteobacteria bacterium]|jgi:polysaccharide export outer membrane protein|nr:polysaccharide export periplasmic protein [Alphaproteobacteria bacterium]
MRRYALVLLTLVAVLCSGLSVHAQGGTEYKLGIGDKVKVVVFGQPDLTGEAEIDASGKIVVGLIGEVVAAGRMIAEVQAEIRSRLDREYLVDPKVSVLMVAYRPITMLGQVKSPGRYPYSSGLTIRQAVALAGGYDKRASTSSAVIFRDGRELEVEIDAPVRPGDTIEIQRRFF